MSPKEASYGMGDPYTVYPTGEDFSIPDEMRDSRTIDMGGVAGVLRSILNGRNPVNLKPFKDQDFVALSRRGQQEALLQYPKVAEGKYGAKTWMPVPSGKLDVGKDIDPTTKKFSEIFGAVAVREGDEEAAGMGNLPLLCGAFSDEETGFLVCSGCAPTDHYAGLPVHIDQREYTEVMVPTIPALVSMMRKKPEEFTDGVVLSLLQTTELLAQCQSRAMAEGRYKINMM